MSPCGRPIRIGLQLRSAASGAEWVAAAQRAENAGFDSISLSDHLGDQFAPLIGLAAIAAATSRIRLTTDVLANDFRNIAVMAKEIATLDVLSGGRAEIGIGAGWMASEYESAGMRFDPPGRRITRLEETVIVLRRLFDGEQVTFDGRELHVKELSLRPRPIQAHLPIAVGGGGPRMMGIAARRADVIGVMTDNRVRVASGQHPNATRSAAALSITAARAAAPERFDALELRIRILMDAVGEDRQSAAQALAARSGLDTTDVLSSPYVLAGSATEIADHMLRARDDLGVSTFIVSAHLLDPLTPVIAALDGR